jgi:hypothetical protein
MTRRSAQLFSVAAVLLLVLSIAAFARFNSTTQQQTAKQNQITADPALKDLPNYRTWTRINDQPTVSLSNNFAIDLRGG